MARLRLRQAGPARVARADRAHRPHEAVDFKVFRSAADLPNGRVAALRVPGGGALTRKEIDDYTAFVEDLRRERPRVHQGQRRRRKPNEEGLQSPIVKFLSRGRAARDPRAHRRRERRRDLLRRRQGKDRQRRARRAARQDRPRARLREQPDGSRCGSSTSRCSSTTTRRKTWAARHHPFTAPKDGHEDRFSSDPATRSPRRTTS